MPVNQTLSTHGGVAGEYNEPVNEAKSHFCEVAKGGRQEPAAA